MELHDAVIYGFPYKLRPKSKIASSPDTYVASFPGSPGTRICIARRAIVACSYLRVIRTASDDNCGGGLGTKLELASLVSFLRKHDVIKIGPKQKGNVLRVVQPTMLQRSVCMLFNAR